MSKTRLIEYLNRFGFSQYDAQAYTALLQNGPMTAYELAGLAEIPRSRIYEIVERLLQKSVILPIDGKPTRYVAQAVDALLKTLESDYARTFNYLRENLPRKGASESEFVWMINSRSDLLKRANDALAAAQQEILVSAFDAELDEILSSLNSKKSLRIGIIQFGSRDIDFPGVYHHPFPDHEYNLKGGRQFTLVMDNVQLIKGIIGCEQECSGVWTANRPLVDIGRDFILHDMFCGMLHTIFRPELTRAFGDDLRDLLKISAFDGPSSWEKARDLVRDVDPTRVGTKKTSQPTKSTKTKAEVRVITDRTDFHVKPLFEMFEKTTGVAVKTTFARNGLLASLEAEPNRADVLITRDAELAVLAQKQGLLSPFSSKMIENRIPKEFRAADHSWTGLSYRARVIFYSKDRVRPKELSTYEDLADERWRGRVCMSSPYEDYNLNLFSQMLEDLGEDRLIRFLDGLKRNLASKPQGSDRDQARAIFEKRCDIALINTYYMAIMLAEPSQRDWAMSSRIFFPNQKAGGSYILMSAAGLTKKLRNADEARRLLEFLVGDLAQNHMALVTSEYVFNPLTELSPVVRGFGDDQDGIEKGVFKRRVIPVTKIAANRDTIIKILNKVRFPS